MTSTIDLNADLGEGCGDDAALMPLISSCNIACGGHAGDAASMRDAVRLAKAAGVAIGAHPSFPDRDGFGRKPLDMPLEALAASLRAQLRTFRDVVQEERASVSHVKPHGALYHAAAETEAIAGLIAGLTLDVFRGAAVMGPPMGALRAAAAAVKIPYIAEGFADRGYTPDGGLVPRGEAGAILEGGTRTAQALALARGEPVSTAQGSISVPVQSICLHGDSPGALDGARAVRAALEAAGLTIAPAMSGQER